MILEQITPEIFHGLKWQSIDRDQFDSKYFNSLALFIISNPGRCFLLMETPEKHFFNGAIVKNISSDYEKIVKYLKYYQSFKIDMPEITFSDCYKKIYIH